MKSCQYPAKQIEELRDIVTAAGVLERTSADFRSHTLPWSLSYDRSPELAVTPSSLEQLQQAIKYLYDSDLEFAARGKGVGSASASDVVLSLRAFQDVLFDEASLTVQIGAGLDWGQVDTKLATLAPGYVVVGARCPYVGVAGSTLTGGLSWLSHELGLGSDPSNLLDAQIVLADGRTIWATEEPDLMWALRGGGGNFGVVANLKLRAHKYTSTIFSGMIRYPAESLYELSAAVANWVRTSPDPKLAMHLFVFDFSARTLHGEAVKPELIALIFDSHGERHARSGKGFQWAFELHGAQPDVREMALPEVHELQRSTESTHGTAETWLEAALISDIDDQTVVRAYHWYENIANNEPDLALGTFALLEVMQEVSSVIIPVVYTY
jgi:FAD/FMN-containing dehydrogenase